MKIAMVNAPLLPVPPVLGGPIERTLYETALKIQTPDMSVISRWAKEVDTWDGDSSDAFFHVDIDAQARHVRDVLGDQTPPALRHRGRARDFFYLNGVTDLLADLAPDVLQVHNFPRGMAYLARQFPDCLRVLYMHNDTRGDDPQIQDGIGVSDRLIFVSHHLAKRYAKRFPDCEARSTVIYNSVDVDALHPKLRTHRKTEAVRRKLGLTPNRTVLFVGRTVPVKGLHCLLDAMPFVLDVLPDVRLVVAGSPLFGAVSDNGYLRRLKRGAQRLGDAVIFTGFVEPGQLPYYYAAADLSVTPSLWQEPFGKVVAEAMASGLPVIGSRRGAIPEQVVDGETGVLIDDPMDVETLADVVVDLLIDADRRAEMGALGRNRAEREFATDVRLARLRAFYDTLGR